MIIIPGGAFILGHKAYVTMLCRALRSVGFLCIAVDYRYWPQTTIDGMVEDVNEAVAWSVQHCGAYGGDRKKIGQLTCRLSWGAVIMRRIAQGSQMTKDFGSIFWCARCSIAPHALCCEREDITTRQHELC